jgi:hypothetical protein
MFERQRAESPSLEIEGRIKPARRPNWCVEVDDKLYIEPGNEFCQQERDSESYCSYFTADYMASLFADATVLPPVSPEWQHCCIVRKTET